METKANYVLVGAFTLAAIVAAFAFVYWTAKFGDRGETAMLRIRIAGSASGLTPGSGVFFNGIRVGDVRNVEIDPNDLAAAIAIAEVKRNTPITKSTKADIGIAGLTGQANIELRGANLDEPKLLDEAEEAGTIAEITANPSAVTNLLQTAQDIFERADKVISNLEGFVSDVREPLTNTVKNAEKFSQALSDNSEGVDDFLASVTKLSEQLAGASDKLDSTLEAAEGLINSVDKDQVKQIVGNVETLTKNLSETSGQIDAIVGRVDRAVTSITEFSDGARQTLGKVDNILEGVDPAQLRKTIENIESASQGATKVIDDVSKVTSKFSEHADEVDKFIADATELADRLNQASVRVDGILVKVDSLLGSDDAKGLAAEASETLKSFKQVADTLNSRLGTITDGLARFSNQGLRDVEALVRDSRRSINRIEEAISDFERNPQRIISGGDGTVRQYSGGRTRR